MAILFVEYPKCSTCQKAKAWLDAHGVAYTDRDITVENPTAQELAAWAEKGGLPLEKVRNASGLKYKALGLAARWPEMSGEEKREALAADGMLVKRPVAVGEDFVLTGFREAEWAAKLL